MMNWPGAVTMVAMIAGLCFIAWLFDRSDP